MVVGHNVSVDWPPLAAAALASPLPACSTSSSWHVMSALLAVRQCASVEQADLAQTWSSTRELPEGLDREGTQLVAERQGLLAGIEHIAGY